MDAVTYPAKEVREITKSFVVVRVEVDLNRELAKKYGVASLSDIRLLDPDGKQLDKLVGFTSAAKLVARAQDALDRLSGKAVIEKKVASGFSPKPAAITKEAVDESVRRGTHFLRVSFKKGWAAADGFSPDELVLYAWSSSGMDPKDENVAALRDRVLSTPLVGTYQASLRALALARLDPAGQKSKIEECAKFLVESQLENGQWTYSPPKGQSGPKIGDNSNSAYALLGLAAARKAGITVPEAAVRKALGCWKHLQNADGGWGYRSDRETESYASMTESGMGSMRLAALMLGGEKLDEGYGRAERWLESNFSVADNRRSAYQEGRLVYHLYALERLGDLGGKVGGHDWYAEGAGVLVQNQNPDGSWDDGADIPVPNTALALLFLSRATEFLK